MPFPATPEILATRDIPADAPATPDARLRAYAWMHLARNTDNRIIDLFRQGLIKGTVTGGQGNEPLAAAIALLADKTRDTISFTHRGLAGHLVWSGHLCDHLNQYLANAASPTLAREGNIHHGDPARRSLPMISHLGAMPSNVLGATHSQRLLGQAAAGIAFYGDGASSTGDIHETLNLASLLKIPLLFLIENNAYAYSTPQREQFAEHTRLHQRAAAYQITHEQLDTTTAPLETILTTLAAALQNVRTNCRPHLIEIKTLRLRGHAAYDTCDYLTPEENAAIQAADPLPNFRRQLVAEHGEQKITRLETTINTHLETCIQHSLQIPRPDPATLFTHIGETAHSDAKRPHPATSPVFTPDNPPLDWTQQTAATEPQTMAQAINTALRKILAERPESILLGQDIATYGGAFKVTENLHKEFGRPRVLNTPVAESACTGYAIGLALNAHRPILEYQFADFATEAITQITQNAATYHFRSGAKVPLVLRLPCGGGLTMGSFHSQELETLLLSTPGLKALYPSTPQDAYNAILAAYEDDNPVLVFEHKALYRAQKTTVAHDPGYRDIWQPKQLRQGSAATLVTYGQMTHYAAEACDYLATEYEKPIDLYDLRALNPLNLEQIQASLARTHRLAILHEGRLTHGFGAELLARLTATNFYDLEAPPLRIASLDLPVPFAPELETAYRPTLETIIEKLTAWLG